MLSRTVSQNSESLHPAFQTTAPHATDVSKKSSSYIHIIRIFFVLLFLFLFPFRKIIYFLPLGIYNTLFYKIRYSNQKYIYLFICKSVTRRIAIVMCGRSLTQNSTVRYEQTILCFSGTIVEILTSFTLTIASCVR